MNHALIFNHRLGSICVNPLNHLELHLDLLSSPPHTENGPPLYRKDGPLPHKKALVEADVDVPKVRSGRVQPAVSLTILVMTSPVAFLCRASLASTPLEREMR